MWKCPITNFPIPKNPRENASVRAEILREADRNQTFRTDLEGLCAQSPYVYMNMFLWTYRRHKIGEGGRKIATDVAHVPFVTWPSQDALISATLEAIDKGEDILARKSRQEGASWLFTGLFDWLWRFRPDTQLIEVSRTEPYVDKTGDPLALFWKHDYLTQHLPDWLIPGPRAEFRKGRGKWRKHLTIINPRNGSTIVGQSCTEHVGAGGGYLAVLFDEMSRMQSNLAAASWRAAADACVCRIANSTSYGGVISYYSRLKRQAASEGTPNIVELMYYNNPERGEGREWAVDVDGSITGTLGRGYWETPWFKARRVGATLQDIGENVLDEDAIAGNTFFLPAVVTAHMEHHAKKAAVRCDLAPDGKSFIRSNHGRWYLWWPLDNRGQFSFKVRDFVGFADPAHGSGSANSVFSIMDVDTRYVGAEFVDPHVTVAELADEMVESGWGIFKGWAERPCYLGWEVDGPGFGLTEELVRRRRYHRVYFQRRKDSRGEPRTRRYGWSSRHGGGRYLLFSMLATALEKQKITIPSKAGLQEMLDTVFLKDGSPEPGERADLDSGARKRHGDRPITYGGLLLMLREIGEDQNVLAGQTAYPPGTAGHLLGHNKVLGLSKDPNAWFDAGRDIAY